MQRQSIKSAVLLPTLLFIVLELIVTQVGWDAVLNWAFYQFHLSQFQANFLFKMGELVIVIGLNAMITKQKFYLGRQLRWPDLLFWIFVLALGAAFIQTPKLWTSIGTGMMGGFSEELLARGVLLGLFLTWTTRETVSLKKILLAVVYSDLIFAAMHLTNITHMPANYVIGQMVLSFFSGLAYAAIYVQTGSLWYAVALHFMKDYMLTASEAAGNAITQFGSLALAALTWFNIAIVIYSLWYWRKHTPTLVKRIRG